MGLKDIFMRTGEKVVRLGTTFDGHPITVKEKPIAEYPGNDKPLIIQINSLKILAHTRAQGHARSAYDGVVINSDSLGHNTSKEGVLNGKVLTSEVFMLSPEKMGLNSKVLRTAMLTESQKLNDYNFFLDNCVDHVIRPLQKAGSSINLGRVSTPRELSAFCENAVRLGQGIRISPEDYAKFIKMERQNNVSSRMLVPPKQYE